MTVEKNTIVLNPVFHAFHPQLIADIKAGLNSPWVIEDMARFADDSVYARVGAEINGTAVVPIFIVREGYQKHRAILGPAVEYEPSGDVGHDVAAICQGYTKAIEKMVARYPDHWMWQHKRWKTRAPGEEA